MSSLQANSFVDMSEYFQRIFDRIWADTKHRRDTARIFKTCIASDEPLPIATIGILTDPAPYLLALSTAGGDNYACEDDEDKVEIAEPQANGSFTWDDDKDDVETARRRVNHRCQDLLEVHAPRSPDLRVSADDYGRIVFMHKSVRDFFDESKTITADLDKHAGPDFDAHLTLSACYVFLVKRATAIHERSEGSVMANRWSTQCLLHMRRMSPHRSMLEVIFGLDVAMRHKFSGAGDHWSNFVDNAGGREDSIDLRTRDLLGHLIEFGLLPCVDAIISKDSSKLQTKEGRPYLDYALRYDPIAIYRSQAPARTLLSPDPDMVSLLLEHGCDVNQVVSIFNSRTLFDLHLRFLYDINASDDTSRRIVWLLIKHGARSVKDRRVPKHTASSGTTARFHVQKHRQTLGHDIISMEDMLAKCFGREEATMMCKQIAKNDAAESWLDWASSFLWG